MTNWNFESVWEDCVVNISREDKVKITEAVKRFTNPHDDFGDNPLMRNIGCFNTKEAKEYRLSHTELLRRLEEEQ